MSIFARSPHIITIAETGQTGTEPGAHQQIHNTR
jgi:hypothetical protein